jgi:MerR family glutamine synthetase transcriptional repressor
VEKSTRVYPIGIVTQLTGLSQRQIRYYESAGLIRPNRTPGKQRLYSPEEIEVLSAIKTLLRQGLTLQGIHNFLQHHSPAEILQKVPDSFQPDLESILEGLQKKSLHADLLEPILRGRGGSETANTDTDSLHKG